MAEKQRNKYLAKALFVLCAFLLLGSVAYAADNNRIMEAITGEEDITLYVKGNVTEDTDITVQIGTAAGDSIEKQKLSDKDIPMQTLVMIDNSLSIPEKDRKKITEILQNLISDRIQQEEVAIATFSEDIVYLTEYTSDYTTLKAAIDKMTYENQETYLTDVLYEVLTEDFIGKSSEHYRRILIISDGVDNKSIGYTKDELYALIKNDPIPVYTIGCVTKNNNEQLENMFALSRMTSADYFNLAELDNLLDVNTVLNADRDIVEVKIFPTPEQLDGSRKAVKLTFGSGETGSSISAEIEFPQKQEAVEEPTPEPTPEPTQKPKHKSEPEPEPEPEQSQFPGWMIWVVILVPAVIVMIIVIVVIILAVKKSKKKKQFEGISNAALQELDNQLHAEPQEVTEIITDHSGGDGHTQMLWNSPATYQIILTDIHSPAKSFQAPLKDSVIVGRKREQCNIVIDYDKSVSGTHCAIKHRGGKFYISDLQSSNGTFINNSKVLSEVEIFSGNVLKLGRVELKFEIR